MTHSLRYRLALLVGLSAVAVLILVTAESPVSPSGLWLMLGFAALILFANAYSVSIGGGEVSIMPMTVAAAYLVMGKTMAGWAVCLSALGYAVVRYRRGRVRPEGREPQGRALIEVTAMNVAMHSLGVLAAAFVFEALGGQVPLVRVQGPSVLALLLSALVYLSVNHSLVASYFAALGRGSLTNYLQSLPKLLVFEGAPLIWAPLFALTYTRLGLSYLLLFASAMIVSSLISHFLADTSQRLQRRLRELGGLQAVGQVLSVSLDVETIVNAVYEQVAKLMPVSSFYVALYDADLDEVSFPVVIEDGDRVPGTARHARRGLTEYVLETAEPLLISRGVTQRVKGLGLELLGREAACWLGVPIAAGKDVLGMMAVQSFDTPAAFDRSHLEILDMIGAQAAVAIQNARLYERTDDALARRVQELDSVLRTTHDGVILLDLELRVLAVNRALAEFVDVAQLNLVRHPIDTLRPDGDPLIALIRYELEDLSADCEQLLKGRLDQVDGVVVLEPSGRHVHRTLTPVRETRGAITGWLLVLRDLTEELELERLREDMTDMLVHDLRSPMSLVLASLAMLREASDGGDEQVQRLIGIAQRSSDRILTLIDDLLDIGQLERGQLPLNLESASAEALVQEITLRYLPVAATNNILLQVDVDPDLPQICVDRSLILRVLSNLVDNALKFTPDGGEVTLSAHVDGERVPGRLLLDVRDTGPGIPNDARPRLFEKFQQIPNIRGRRRGTGLGLPFCKLVVEAHGGRIWVESEPDLGSTFSLTLPLEPSAVADRF